MSFLSIGDLAQTLRRQKEVGRLNAALDKATGELVSGRSADRAAATGGALGGLAALSRDITLAGAYRMAADTLDARLTAAQLALGMLGDVASSTAHEVLALGDALGLPSITLVGARAHDRIEDVLATLNSRHAGHALFAGMQSTGPATGTREALLADLRTEIAGATGPGEVVARIEAFFAPGGRFETDHYTGGPAREPVRVAPGSRVEAGPTALEPSIGALLAGLSLAAIAGEGSPLSAREDRASMMRTAGLMLVGAADAVTGLRGTLGQQEERLERIRQSEATRVARLELAVNEVGSVDPFDAATQLQSLQTNLETLYTVTARRAGLSLVNFLR